jgi:hypothetical protein
VIQAKWSNLNRSFQTGPIEYNQAAELFYYYGNAYAGVVDRVAAIAAIESRGLRAAIEKIVWPQTVMGFLAMHDLSLRKPYAVNFEIGMPLAGCLNITNKQYWITSFVGLLSAASMVDDSTGKRIVSKKFLRWSCHGFRGHIRAVLSRTLVEKSNASTGEARKILRTKFGIKGHLWATVLRLADFPIALEIISKSIYFVLSFGKISRFNAQLNDARKHHEMEVSHREQSGKRYGDWF